MSETILRVTMPDRYNCEVRYWVGKKLLTLSLWLLEWKWEVSA